MPCISLIALLAGCLGTGAVGEDDDGDDTAASTDTSGGGTGTPDPVDADGDGFSDDVDCDDSTAAVHPGAAEVCDSLDNDCDEATSEVGMASWTDSVGVTSDVTSRFSGTATDPEELFLEDGTLALCEGTFYAIIRTLGDVRIVGAGRDLTRISAPGTTAIYADGDTAAVSLTLEALTVAESGDSGPDVPGIKAVRAPLTATEIGLEDCPGGAMRIEDTNADIHGLVATGNTGIYGGALYLYYADSVTVEDATFTDNIGSYGGAIYIEGYGGGPTEMSLTNVTLERNHALDHGGGIYVRNAPVVAFVGGAIEGNRAITGQGGGVFLELVEGMVFATTGTDFGLSSVGEYNAPDDVYVSGAPSASEVIQLDGVSIVCTETGCV